MLKIEILVSVISIIANTTGIDDPGGESVIRGGKETG